MEISELVKLMQKKQRAYHIAREEYLQAKESGLDETKLSELKVQLDRKEKEYQKVAKQYAELRDKRWANKAVQEDEKIEEVEEEPVKPNSSKKDEVLRIEDKSMYQQIVPSKSFFDKYKKEIEESPNFKEAVKELKDKIEKKQQTVQDKKEKKQTTQQESNKALPVRSFWEIYNSTCTRTCRKYSKCYQQNSPYEIITTKRRRYTTKAIKHGINSNKSNHERSKYTS